MQSTIVLKRMAQKMEEDHGDYDTAKSVTGKIRRFSEALGKIDSMKNNPDPLISETMHKKKLHDYATQTQKRATGLENELYGQLRTRQTELEEAITRRADLHPKQTDAETRQVLREMPIQERIDTAMKAAKNGDSSIMSAIANGNQLLTGIDEDTRQKALDVFKHKKAPEQMQELKANDQLFHDIVSTMSFVSQTVKSALDPANVEKANAASQRAKKLEAELGHLLNDNDLEQTG